MRGNKPRDTRPEMRVRRGLHAAGYRFRLHRADLPGRPDLVFPALGAVIQVHGCFWHQHAGCACARAPTSRRNYWGPKLARNVERDSETSSGLAALGWRVHVVWECELADEVAALRRAAEYLGPPGRPARRRNAVEEHRTASERVNRLATSALAHS